MHVSLTDRVDEYVREKVASGLCNDASEVIREALWRQIAEEETLAAKQARLLEEIDIGIARADRGEFAGYSLEKSLAKLRVGD